MGNQPSCGANIIVKSSKNFGLIIDHSRRNLNNLYSLPLFHLLVLNNLFICYFIAYFICYFNHLIIVSVVSMLKNQFELLPATTVHLQRELSFILIFPLMTQLTSVHFSISVSNLVSHNSPQTGFSSFPKRFSLSQIAFPPSSLNPWLPVQRRAAPTKPWQMHR